MRNTVPLRSVVYNYTFFCWDDASQTLESSEDQAGVLYITRASIGNFANAFGKVRYAAPVPAYHPPLRCTLLGRARVTAPRQRF